MTGITKDDVRPALARWAERMDAVAPELNALDGRLGDGDLGATLQKCAANVRSALPALPDDLGGIFRTCGLACARASGSSFGTLLALSFMTAAKTIGNDCEEMPASYIAPLLAAVTAALSARGGASLGDKTVLDAIDASRAAVAGCAPPQAQLSAAIAAVDATIAEFRGKPCRIGRARMFADRSAALDDPGMVAFRHMLLALDPSGVPGAAERRQPIQAAD